MLLLLLMRIPQTKYARSGSVNIAYQIFGDGSEYLIFIPGWCSNLEEVWNIPQLSAWLRQISIHYKLVLFDKRGTGLSDRVYEQDLPNQDQRASDLLAVMDNHGIKKAALFGLSEGGAMASLFAYQYPEMVSHLILFGSFAKWTKSEDYAYGLTLEQHNRIKQYIFDHWGEPVGLHLMAPTVKDNVEAQKQWATFLRRSGSPNAVKVLYEMNIEIDIREILDKITTPTLIMHRKDDRLIENGHSYYLNKKIKHSQLLITEGTDHLPWYSVQPEEIIAIHTFLKEGNATLTKKMSSANVEDFSILYTIRDYIVMHFHENISLKSLSKQFGINLFKLKTGFKLLFESPVIEFLTNTRLENACRLLMNPNETILSVAHLVGYGYASNFSHAFKRKYGITPLQYKFKVRNGLDALGAVPTLNN
jgi:pimeloyl-ACP methyl ester carboxylesterase/AraC-like DNA-binding protein